MQIDDNDPRSFTSLVFAWVCHHISERLSRTGTGRCDEVAAIIAQHGGAPGF
jgi:hypothetical protein